LSRQVDCAAEVKQMAFDANLRKLWAILAIPGVLLGIGASYKSGGLSGLRDLTSNMFQSVGLHHEASAPVPSNLLLRERSKTTPSVTLGADEIFWLTIQDSSDSTLFNEFLKKFPNSPRIYEARAKLEELEKAPHPAAQQQPRMPMREQGGAPMMMGR
jgi:hypothetical protein